jgi:TorA maturation chaperone TorD
MNQMSDIHNIEAEDQARADWYALLARLWYAAPDTPLLQSIASANEALNGEGATPLEAAWRQICIAAMAMNPESVRLEYDNVFIGTGKAEVTPYMAHYFPGTTGKEKILLRIRQRLEVLRLERADGRHEPEDHIAALCDVMRHLILRSTAQAQAEFFRDFLQPAWRAFIEKAECSPNTGFYKHVVRFSAAYFAVEEQAFAML